LKIDLFHDEIDQGGDDGDHHRGKYGRGEGIDMKPFDETGDDYNQDCIDHEKEKTKSQDGGRKGEKHQNRLNQDI